MTMDDKIKQYFDIKLDTLNFLIKNQDEIANTTRASGYFADIVFFAQFFGFDKDDKFIESARKFCRVYNLNIDDYDLDIPSEEE